MSAAAKKVIEDTLWACDDFHGTAQTREVLAALDTAGFVIVPKEPAPEMIAAGARAGSWFDGDGAIVDDEYDQHAQRNAAEVYRAMINATLVEKAT